MDRGYQVGRHDYDDDDDEPSAGHRPPTGWPRRRRRPDGDPPLRDGFDGIFETQGRPRPAAAARSRCRALRDEPDVSDHAVAEQLHWRQQDASAKGPPRLCEARRRRGVAPTRSRSTTRTTAATRPPTTRAAAATTTTMTTAGIQPDRAMSEEERMRAQMAALGKEPAMKTAKGRAGGQMLAESRVQGSKATLPVDDGGRNAGVQLGRWGTGGPRAARVRGGGAREQAEAQRAARLRAAADAAVDALAASEGR